MQTTQPTTRPVAQPVAESAAESAARPGGRTARTLARVARLVRPRRRPAPERPGRPDLRRPRPRARWAPRPARVADRTHLASVGAAIAAAGTSASHALFTQVADQARTRGVTSPAVGLLDDPAAPDVVRNRAFAIVAGRLRGATRHPDQARPQRPAA